MARGEQLRVALIGTGFMGRTHSIAYAILPSFFPDLPMVQRKVVADLTETLAKKGAHQFGFDEWSADWRDVVARQDIDIVDIVTPNDSHSEIAEAALDAGKHVLCEKPLALSADEARRMTEKAATAKGVHMVVFNYRRCPAVKQARRLIEEGALGRILTFRGFYLQDWAMPDDTPWSWRFSAAQSGSGALGDIGSHLLDMAEFLVGDVTAVAAAAETFVGERPVHGETGSTEKTAPVDVDDCTMALLRFDGGAIGTVESSRFSYGRKNHLSFEISGTKGALAFDWERSNELRFYDSTDRDAVRGFRTILMGPDNPGGEVLWPIPGIGTGYIETQVFQVADFVRAIVAGGDDSAGFAHGWRIQEVMEAIMQAAAQGCWVSIEPKTAGNQRGATK